MLTENLCGANLSYYEMCERNVKVWIPYVVVDTDKKDHKPKIIWYVYVD